MTADSEIAAQGRPSQRRFLILLFLAIALPALYATSTILIMQSSSTNCFDPADLTSLQVSSVLTTPLELFKMHVGRYPHRLDELLDPCINCSDSAQWKGPYIKNATKLIDPWAHDLIYQIPGLHNKSSYDLSSPGPDGVADTADDITNW